MTAVRRPGADNAEKSRRLARAGFAPWTYAVSLQHAYGTVAAAIPCIRGVERRCAGGFCCLAAAQLPPRLHELPRRSHPEPARRDRVDATGRCVPRTRQLGFSAR